MDADYIAGDKGLRQLVEGCIVEIQGLKGAPQHNGVQGKPPSPLFPELRPQQQQPRSDDTAASEI
jgi:hypothetical protein